MIDGGEFFCSQEEHTWVKSQLVAKYVPVWAKIIAGSRFVTKVIYLDAMAGKGRFDNDGRAATPLLVLDNVLKVPKLVGLVQIILNDANPDFVRALQQNMAASGAGKLGLPPIYLNLPADSPEFIQSVAARAHQTPVLAFIDPFARKGLSSSLIRTIIPGWGSECIIFVNVPTFRRQISNRQEEPALRDLLGDAPFEKLRAEFPLCPPRQQEKLLLDQFEIAMKALGARYVTKLRLHLKKPERIYFVLFLTKHPLGLEIVKGIMKRAIRAAGVFWRADRGRDGSSSGSRRSRAGINVFRIADFRPDRGDLGSDPRCERAPSPRSGHDRIFQQGRGSGGPWQGSDK